MNPPNRQSDTHTHTPAQRPDHCSWALLAVFIAVSLLLGNAPSFALLVGDDGLIEPVIVQIKDSLRTSLDLDSQLAALAALEKENGLSEVEWYAGPKLLVKLSFPKEVTDDEALKAISALQESEAVEKVVVQSAANLEFKSADFARSWKPDEAIPDAARRGFDAERLKRPQVTYDEKTELPLHVANQIIVRWKDEYVWNDGHRALEQQFASFNSEAECTVVEEQRYTEHDLTQVLEFDAVSYSVLNQLLMYQANEMVDYVQPNYLYETQSTFPNDTKYSLQWSLPKIGAPEAWDIQKGSSSNPVVVAILDTGANVANTNGHVAHPDLSPNTWSDQNNGGAHNFTTTPYSTDVYDYTGSGHGSNVASIIGARGNNNLGLCGLNWYVSLMHLKVLPVPSNSTPNGKTSAIAAAIDYAVGHGASVMNMSFGAYYCTKWHYTNEDGQVCDIFGVTLFCWTPLSAPATAGCLAFREWSQYAPPVTADLLRASVLLLKIMTHRISLVLLIFRLTI